MTKQQINCSVAILMNKYQTKVSLSSLTIAVGWTYCQLTKKVNDHKTVGILLNFTNCRCTFNSCKNKFCTT